MSLADARAKRDEAYTRACAFCNVATGKPNALDMAEPEKVAKAVKQMGLPTPSSPPSTDELADGERIVNGLALRRSVKV